MLKVDQDKCEGCGVCEAMCPEVFKMEDGKSHIIEPDYASCDCKIQDVVESCPENAISL